MAGKDVLQSNEMHTQALPDNPTDRLRLLVNDMLEDARQALQTYPKEPFALSNGIDTAEAQPYICIREDSSQPRYQFRFPLHFYILLPTGGEVVRTRTGTKEGSSKRYGFCLEPNELHRLFTAVTEKAQQELEIVPSVGFREIDQVLKELNEPAYARVVRRAFEWAKESQQDVDES